MENKFIDTIQVVLMVFLIVFGLFIAYQIFLKIIGGSWQTEVMIIALLFFNIGLTSTIAFSLSKLTSDHHHLKYQFRCLAKDFKEHLSVN